MKNLKIYLLILIAVLMLAGCSLSPAVPTTTPTLVPSETPTPSPKPIPATDEERSLKVGELERTYYLHIPDGLNSAQSVPLVFLFHGYTENGAYARNYSGMDDIANANGFVVVYPEGSGSDGSPSWNAGLCCGGAVTDNVDDFAFVRAIIADVETVVGVDPKRIYAAGFSNGALLSYRLACEMSDTFAAVAPAGGTLVTSPCEPSQPVSLIHIHGVNDQAVPIDGGGSGIQFPSVLEGISAWAKLDGCSGEEQVEHEGVLTHTTYGTCAPGIAVESYMVDGIGHSWPSKYVAPVSQIVWDFFAAHPKP
jgi:polyhydroxybutyrate depolymerase